MRSHPALLTLGAFLASSALATFPTRGAGPGTLTLAGTFSLGAYTTLSFANSETIAGSGAIVFQDELANAILLSGNSTTLTIGPGVLIRGGSSVDFSAQVGASPFYPSGTDISILNQGTISADSAGTHIALIPTGTGSFFNTGLIQAAPSATLTVYNLSGDTGTTLLNGGILNLSGSLTLASLGTFSRTGGTVNLTGNLFGNLPLTPITGSWNLAGGTLTSGTLTSTGGASLTFSGSSCAFSSITSNIPLDFSSSHTALSITGNLTLNAPCTLGSSSALVFLGNQVLAGASTLTLLNQPGNALALSGTNPSLLIAAGITIHGGSSFANAGIIGVSPLYSPPLNASITNQGVINADAPGADIYIKPAGFGTFVNSGTIMASAGGTLLVNSILGATGAVVVNGGVLILGGTLTQPALGTFVRTGGTVNLTGNLRGGLALDASTGSWNLLGGTLTSGLLSGNASTRLILTNFGGTLSSITTTADLDLTTTSSQVTIISGFTLNATARLGAFAAMFFSDTQTLSGNGAILFQDQPGSALVLGSAASLTIGPGILIHGGSSIPTAAQIGASPFFASGSATTIINQGTISADAPACQITINTSGGSFTNLATLRATAGGSLIIYGQTQGTGNILVDAGSFLISDGLLTSSLAITGSVTLRPGSTTASTSKVAALSLAKSGSAYVARLDLGAGKFIVQSSSLADKAGKLAVLLDALHAGFAGGTWSGNGITSSSAASLSQQYSVGFFDNGILGLPTFGGQPVDSSSILMAISHIGDANGSGIIDIQDQSIVTNHWQSARSHWDTGDLNYDGFVDLQDLTLVTNNWQKTSTFPVDSSNSVLSPQSFPLGIPEPATLLLALPALLLLRRHRRAT